MANDKIFCGKGKKANFSIKLNICLSDIPREYITESKGKEYVRLELKERREPDDRGNTHFITVDTWKPNGSTSSRSPAPQQNPDDDLPWG